MSLDYEIRKPRDLDKININDAGEMLWWSYHFGITIEKLLSCISRYGTNPKEIAKHVKES